MERGNTICDHSAAAFGGHVIHAADCNESGVGASLSVEQKPTAKIARVKKTNSEEPQRQPVGTGT